MGKNRTAAERRHHRDRVIAKRIKNRTGVYGSWEPEYVGVLDKDHSVPKFASKVPRPSGNYIVAGVTRPEYWDELPDGSTRQALKRELRQDLESI